MITIILQLLCWLASRGTSSRYRLANVSSYELANVGQLVKLRLINQITYHPEAGSSDPHGALLLDIANIASNQANGHILFKTPSDIV